MGLKLIQEQKTVNEAINSEEKSAIALKQAQLNIIGQQNAFQTIFFVQWLWLSWQSSRFKYQRFAV